MLGGMFRLRYLLLAAGLLVLFLLAALHPGASGVGIGAAAPDALPAGSGGAEGIVIRKQDVVIDISKDCEKYDSCPP